MIDLFKEHGLDDLSLKMCCETIISIETPPKTPGTCSHGTTYSGSFSSVSSGVETLEYLGTLVGWINSSVVTSVYTIGNVPAVNQAAKCVGAYGTSASTTCVFGSNVTSGNYALVFQANTDITSYGTPTKSSGTATIGTPTQEGSCPTSGFTFTGCYWLIPIIGTGSLTIGLSQTSSGGAYNGGGIYEIAYSTGTVDAVSTFTGSNCGSCTGSSLSTLGANRIVLTSIYGIGTLSSPSPFSFNINAADSQGNIVGLGSYKKSASGSYTPTWTGTNATGRQSIAIY